MTPDEIKAALSKNVTVSARRKLHIAASRKGYVPFRDAAYILESAINTTFTTALVQEIRALRKTLTGLKHWAHWANEKLGYETEPLFPEWKETKEALSRTAWVNELEADNKEGA